MVSLALGFGEFKGIKEPAFQIVSLELDGAVMDRSKAEMMPALHMNTEPGALWSGRLQTAAAPATDNITNSFPLVDGHVKNGPGPFVTVNMPCEGYVDSIFFVKGDQMPRIGVPLSERLSRVSLQGIPIVILIRTETGMVVRGKFPRRLGSRSEWPPAGYTRRRSKGSQR